MNILQNEIIHTIKIYRELFLNAQSALDKQIDSLKKSSLCNKCKADCTLKFEEIRVLDKFPDGCKYKFWQEATLNLLENKLNIPTANAISVDIGMQKPLKNGLFLFITINIF